VAVIAGEKPIWMTSLKPAKYARPIAGVAKVEIAAGTSTEVTPRDRLGSLLMVG
jgi:hypothetical protein